jgi:hypothetical protein
MISPTKICDLITTAAIHYLHKEGVSVEVPMLYVEALVEMFKSRGATGIVQTKPVPERPFVRFLWRSSLVFAYQLNENFAEFICDGPNEVKQEFQEIVATYISLLQEKLAGGEQ